VLDPAHSQILSPGFTVAVLTSNAGLTFMHSDKAEHPLEL